MCNYRKVTKVGIWICCVIAVLILFYFSFCSEFPVMLTLTSLAGVIGVIFVLVVVVYAKWVDFA